MSQINETALRTPGVYTTEIPTLPPSVAQVSTAVPAFIGYTQIATDEIGRSLISVPTKIFSLADYQLYFGLADNETGITVNVEITTDATGAIVQTTGQASIVNPSVHNMYYCVRLYFENGGGPCYIVSVGPTTNPLDPDELAGTGLHAGEGLAALAACDEPTLILFPEGQGLAENAYYTVIGQAIDQCAQLQDRFTFVDVHTPQPSPLPPPPNDKPNTTTTMAHFRAAFARNNDLNYAAAYYPNLRTNFVYRYDRADVNVIITHRQLPVPPAAAPLPVVDPPVRLNTLENIQSAIYNLCLDRIRNQISPTLPPSAAMAGIYAKVDGSRGVWKAPANVSINSVYEVTDFITDAEQGDMNIDPGSGKSVNAIRPFNGKGILVWGARTLDGNSNEWRFISVRRLFIMVEESAKKSTFQFVFEPNDSNTWVKVRAMLENYLTVLWRQGALAGAKPEQAFFVKCGLGSTMTAQDILEGKLIVEIGMAAVRPAEFIILRFMHKLQES
jgi:phage tail sheath protein FI